MRYQRRLKKYLLIDENISGDHVFYEGDTVVFAIEAIRHRRDPDEGGNLPRPGDKYQLGVNSFSSLKRFDVAGYPEELFSRTTIDNDGFARWEYTFIDDGLKEGLEEARVSFVSHDLGGASFNLVVSDSLGRQLTMPHMIGQRLIMMI